MHRTTNTVVAVGIFFVVAVLGLFYLSIRTSGPSARDRYPLYMEVEDAKGLDRGAEVARAGVLIGNVDKLSLVPDQNKVRIDLLINKNAQVRSDASAAIQVKSLLGTYYVHISHGKTGAALSPGQAVPAEDVMDVNGAIQAVGKLGGEAGGVLSKLDKNQDEFFKRMNDAAGKVNEMLDENRDNLKKITDVFASQAPNIEKSLKAIAEASDALKSTSSTLGRLIYTDDLYKTAQSATTNLRDISGQVRSGKGTVGKLIYDDKLSSQTTALFATATDAASSMKIFADEAVHAANSLDKVGNNLVEITDKVNKGQGTVGKLINDDALYDEIRAAVGQVRKTFEEGEEQSVLRTFMGVFFGSMM
ncbi:TPA: hypothetical protein DDW35_01285 [Candidatus Sumerlaeota bacterium]|jgi:phospholipid/cholesterol/gamma-HCH transport system substrate-binding protein|nr:hypothetical protein [Candidatus Sumerlaeota bacterium]